MPWYKGVLLVPIIFMSLFKEVNSENFGNNCDIPLVKEASKISSIIIDRPVKGTEIVEFSAQADYSSQIISYYTNYYSNKKLKDFYILGADRQWNTVAYDEGNQGVSIQKRYLASWWDIENKKNYLLIIEVKPLDEKLLRVKIQCAPFSQSDFDEIMSYRKMSAE